VQSGSYVNVPIGQFALAVPQQRRNPSGWPPDATTATESYKVLGSQPASEPASHPSYYGTAAAATPGTTTNRPINTSAFLITTHLLRHGVP
jgi:hypothetical protein